MAQLKEVPRAVCVVVGEYPSATVYVMVSYDVRSGDSWNTFPPREECVPWLVGEVTQESDYLYYCTVEWLTKDGQKHSGKIQVTPVFLSLPWSVEYRMDSE